MKLFLGDIKKASELHWYTYNSPKLYTPTPSYRQSRETQTEEYTYNLKLRLFCPGGLLQ